MRYLNCCIFRLNLELLVIELIKFVQLFKLVKRNVSWNNSKILQLHLKFVAHSYPREFISIHKTSLNMSIWYYCQIWTALFWYSYNTENWDSGICKKTYPSPEANSCTIKNEYLQEPYRAYVQVADMTYTRQCQKSLPIKETQNSYLEFQILNPLLVFLLCQ